MFLSVRSATIVAAIVCGGCASHPAAPYDADYDSVDRLKTAGLGKLKVSPVQPVSVDAPLNKITLRGARFVAAGGTFSKYIEDALVRDLSEAGLFDKDAGTQIAVTLLANDVNVLGFTTGYGTLDLDVAVARGGQQRLTKIYRTTTEFDSSFMGMIAVQQGQAAYPALVRAALKKIYSDPEFLNAVRN